MTIAVAIDGVGYDATDKLTATQRQISQNLTFASPRDVTDLSQVFKFSWPAASTTPGFSVSGDTATTINGNSFATGLNGPTQFDTLINTSYNQAGDPIYSVYFRDDSGALHYLSGGTGANNVVVASPGNSATASLIGTTGSLPDGTTRTIQSGDIIQNPGAGTPSIVGQVQFEGQSGLSLAAINTRLSDINNVIETLAKVLSTQSDLFNTASGLVR